MRILLLGKDGQVGWELRRALVPIGEVSAVGRAECDLGDPEAIRAAIRSSRPGLIVNAAAYTAVDRAEQDEARAYAINAEAPRVLAREAAQIGAALVHYSTDYVFDGTKSGPYVEEDRANPLGVYGRSKHAGELEVERAGCPYLIFRTSWVYASRGHNFLLTMLRLANSKPELRVVCDQVGVPTWSRLVADVTAAVLRSVDAKLNGRAGTYHLTARGQTSWHGFAQEIIALGSQMSLCPSVPVVPIPTRDYPTNTPRPPNSALSHEKLVRTFGFPLPDWRESVHACMQELASARSDVR
jgi:dTDP-4-dehydrorhamnose reductase